LEQVTTQFGDEYMTGGETQTEKHTRLARQLLDDARHEIAAGDLVQSSEKLWGGTSQALKSYCASHGLPHGEYANRRHAAFQLAEQMGNSFIRAMFGVAQSCHSNFYNDWIEQERLDGYLPDIEALVNLVLDARAGQ